jgi:tetratricopeptide (TPR) repeat protein
MKNIVFLIITSTISFLTHSQNTEHLVFSAPAWQSKSQPADTLFSQGLEKFRLKDYRGAIADYTKAIELNPKYAEAYHNRGLSKINFGQKDNGCLDLSKAGELGLEQAYEAIKNLCN